MPPAGEFYAQQQEDIYPVLKDAEMILPNLFTSRFHDCFVGGGRTKLLPAGYLREEERFRSTESPDEAELAGDATNATNTTVAREARLSCRMISSFFGDPQLTADKEYVLELKATLLPVE